MTALLEEINQILVPHKYLWDEMSKQEKEQRKLEWKKINHSLKVLARIEFRGSYMKAHKEFFMHGVVKQPFLKIIDTLNTYYEKEIEFNEFIKKNQGWHTGEVEFAGAFPLFYMWYLPKMNEQLADEIITHFSGDLFNWGGGYAGLFGARRLLWKSFIQGDYRENGTYCALGPRMQYIAPRMIGDKRRTALFDQKATTADSNFDFTINKFIPRMNVTSILKGDEFSVNKINQFIWPQASWYLDQHLIFLRNIENKSNINNFNYRCQELLELIISIECLVFFEQHPETSKECDFSIECQQQITQQYQNGEFSPEMNQLFELVDDRGVGKTSVEDVLELIQ